MASVLASVELRYGRSTAEVDAWRARFARLMTENLFWPSGRILNNAGSQQSQLASCFVLPLEDEFESIFDTLATHTPRNSRRTAG